MTAGDEWGVARLGTRPSLDGVRALAVLLVAGVHARPKLLPGGSIGVDVFFVLSGFLITTLLLEELDTNGRIHFGRFYARRALRLLPALAGLLVAVVVWAVVVASPGTRHDALREVVAAASYTRNMPWWDGVPGTLLGHTWSLALEEQFYLVWPVLLALLVRPRRSARGLTVLFVLLWVVVGALRLAEVAGPGLFWVQRPEALLLGAAVALTRRRHATAWVAPRARSMATAGVVAGALGLVGLALWDDADRMFGVGFSLAAVAAVLLVLGLVVLEERGVGGWFARRPVVLFGRMSYGFYLWHMPVLRWVDDRLVGRSAMVRLPLGLGLALLATAVSYRVLEQPALRWKDRFRPPQGVTPEDRSPRSAVPG